MVQVVVNPFYFGGSIKERRHFIGRQRVVAEIFDAIHRSASVSIVGERRVGKSSLLRYIADPTVERKNGLEPERYVFVYFDFQGLPTISSTELWRRIMIDAAGQVRNPLLLETIRTLTSGQQEITLADLQSLLDGFKQADMNLVLLFDEFDTAAANPNFDQAFFGSLRSLEGYQVSYIVASHRSLIDLQFAHAEVITSPFFNFFRRVTLGGFSPDEVELLLAEALRDTGVAFNAADRERLSFWADGHPYFLQTAGYFLFDAHRFGFRDGARVDYVWVENRVRDNALDHFRYYWQGSEPGEQRILATLALLETDVLDAHNLWPDPRDPMLRRLGDRVLVAETAGGRPRIFSTLFGEWIDETISFVPVAQTGDLGAMLEIDLSRGFQRDWIETTDRIRRGLAWVNVKAITRWLIAERGVEKMFEWMDRIIEFGKR